MPGGKAASGIDGAGGLGTVIVAALVKQLDARLDIRSDATGLSASVTRATFKSRLPDAA